MKKYAITTALSNISVTFAGNDSAKTITAAVDAELHFSDILRSNSNELSIRGKGRFRVVKARLSFVGAEGLNAGAAKAAELSVSVMSTGSTPVEVASFVLPFSNLEEWEDKDIDVELHGIDDDWDGVTGEKFDNRICKVYVNTGSSVVVNDFNVQNAFLSKTRGAKLELEIEADAFLDATTGEAV